jgi:enterochelin esterase-like enzyme
MSFGVQINCWRLLGLAFLLSACASTPASLHSTSPLKATPEPSMTSASATKVSIPSPDPTGTPEPCLETNGRLVEDSYALPNGSDTAPYIVYLPPCYDLYEEAYPVGFFLHGYPQNEDHWIRLGAIESYEGLLSAGGIGPMVMIFPYQPEPYFTQTDGGPGSLEDLLQDHLSSAVYAGYRISPIPADHAILGVSRGGVWALEIGLRHPERFNIVAALSPALAYNHPRRSYDPFEIARSAEELPEFLMISAGDREPQFSNEIDRFVSELERFGINFIFLQHEGRHEDQAWQSIMDQVFLFLADALRENRTPVR